MAQKRLITSVILLKGFTAIIIQTLLFRELLVIFSGNELTFAIILTTWLLSGALGSGLMAHFFKKTQNPAQPYSLFQLALSIWIPLSLWLIRSSHQLLKVPSSQILPIANIILITASSLAVVSFLDAAMFTIGFRLIARITDKKSSAMAGIYLLESIGIVIGGLVFTFIFLAAFNSVQIVFLLSCANLLAGFLLLKNTPWFSKRAIFAFFFLVSLICFYHAGTIQKIMLKTQWHDKNIIAYENSPYGNVAVSQEGRQYTIFYDGLPAISIPAPDIFFTQDFIHLPMLADPGAKTILFIGHAAGGLIQETLKYPRRLITYCEIDPLFIKTIQHLKNQQVQDELNNPRVSIQFSDGRYFVKTTQHQYDAVFIEAGLPTSLSINRYYTREFFEEIKRILRPKGMAVFKTWGSLAYLSDEYLTMNAMLYKTLKTTFNYLDVIPGDGYNIFIASDTARAFDAAAMSAYAQNIGLKTSLINTTYLNLRLDRAYRQWFLKNIEPDLLDAAVNQDLKPAGLYEGLRLYYAQFSRQIPALFKTFKKTKTSYFALVVLLFLAGLGLLTHRKNRFLAVEATVLTSGIFTMSVQVSVLFLFQSLLGILFQWLAILTMSFMTGVSLGTILANKKLKTLSSFKKLSLIESLLPITTLILIMTIAIFHKNIAHPESLKILFFLACVSGGTLIGLELPISYELLTQGAPAINPDNNKAHQTIAGRLYCMDLAGACAGAMITPLILIPNCGIITTTALLCLLKIGNSVNLLTLKENNTKF